MVPAGTASRTWWRARQSGAWSGGSCRTGCTVGRPSHRREARTETPPPGPPPAEGGGAPVNQVRGLEDRAAPGARLAAPPIDVKRELKPAAPAGAGAVVSEGRALSRDGFAQHGADFTIEGGQRSEEHTSELQSPLHL